MSRSHGEGCLSHWGHELSMNVGDGGLDMVDGMVMPAFQWDRRIDGGRWFAFVRWTRRVLTYTCSVVSDRSMQAVLIR